ncbi:hypothetical protein B5S29_g5150 [[Candida] boidinii]|nr:hypothetical protein B5S29_g5150 [[Candida] boidinii]
MFFTNIKSVKEPENSILFPIYKSAYFIDSYSVKLPTTNNNNNNNNKNDINPELLANFFFNNPPKWFTVLLNIRDKLVSAFGIKSTDYIRNNANKLGIKTIGFFPIISSSKNEIILGDDDKHLDFRASLLIQPIKNSNNNNNNEEKELVATTVVHCHGLLGKLYLNIIKPFHVLIIKHNLSKVPELLSKID